nr:hypothetical protein [Tanacetum cinerariifolium]
VVDVYIPIKKSKAGKKFAFVCFLNVDNFERLIENIGTIWMGRFRLHANPVRFQREPRDHKYSTPPKENVGLVKHSFASVLKSNNIEMPFSSPAIEKMLSHVGVASWFSEFQHAIDYFVSEEKLVWISIEGLPKVTWKFNSCKDCFLMGFAVCKQGTTSADPFGIYHILNRNNVQEKVTKDVSSKEQTFPPGFTWTSVNDKARDEFLNSHQQKSSSHGNSDGMSVERRGNSRPIKIKSGGSILEVMEDLVKIGQTMGYNMEGCSKNIEAIVGFEGDSQGFVAEFFAYGIRECLSKTMLLYRILFWLFVLLIVSVYAPQDFSERKILWDYIAHMIQSWEGECVILRDFNEVRFEHQIFGTNFNDSRANAFNHFILSAGLIDLPLEDGFDKIVEDAWKNSGIMETMISLLKMKLHALKSVIKTWCKEDKKNSNEYRFSMQSRLTELDKLFDKGKSTDALVLAIRGVLVNGDWIEEPSKVKDEFLNHFANPFSMPDGPCMTLDASLFKQISFYHNVDLESNVNYEEIKSAVWDCGTNKSPEPDGFILEFFRRYWTIINQDVVNAIQEFFASAKAMVFKADVEKAFDSVRWDYLDDILSNFGFGAKWRGWIQGCLNPEMGSIIVNGSPSSEFSFHKGHKINIIKSTIMGIGTTEEEVNSAAKIIGCSTFSSPFKYLSWKAKLLSIGGRFTLIKSVLTSLPLYFMSIYKASMGVLHKLESIRRNFFNEVDNNERKVNMIGWKKILATKRKGVLGVSSFLLIIVRFYSSGFGDSGLIKSHFGLVKLELFMEKISLIQTHGLLIKLFPKLFALESNKNAIVAEKFHDISLSHSFRRRPRGGAEEEQYCSLVEKLNSVVLSNSTDRWVWSIESSGEFSSQVCVSVWLRRSIVKWLVGVKWVTREGS